MNKSDIFWQTYLNLENSLVDLGKYVLISDVSNSDGWRSQLDVFSPYIADLLVSCCVQIEAISKEGTVAKLAMRQPFVLFKGLTFQKLCLPGAFRPGDHHNKMLRPGLCVVHASPQYL